MAVPCHGVNCEIPIYSYPFRLKHSARQKELHMHSIFFYNLVSVIFTNMLIWLRNGHVIAGTSESVCAIVWWKKPAVWGGLGDIILKKILTNEKVHNGSATLLYGTMNSTLTEKKNRTYPECQRWQLLRNRSKYYIKTINTPRQYAAFLQHAIVSIKTVHRTSQVRCTFSSAPLIRCL